MKYRIQWTSHYPSFLVYRLCVCRIPQKQIMANDFDLSLRLRQTWWIWIIDIHELGLESITIQSRQLSTTTRKEKRIKEKITDVWDPRRTGWTLICVLTDTHNSAAYFFSVLVHNNPVPLLESAGVEEDGCGPVAGAARKLVGDDSMLGIPAAQRRAGADDRNDVVSLRLPLGGENGATHVLSEHLPHTIR